MSAQPRLRLRVAPAAEGRLRAGHPWLFAESIREQNRPGHAGELAVVYDRKDRFLAVGLFDPVSPIRLRVLHAGRAVAIDGDWWSRRLETALARRQGLADGETTGLRLVHGESDGWPGLVLDRYEDTLVLKLYSAAWLPRLQEICRLIQARLRPERVVLRLSRNVQPAATLAAAKLPAGSTGAPAETGEVGDAPHRNLECSYRDGSILFGPPLAGPVCFRESGLRFEADVLRGQKTGFFLDQRENRRKVEVLAAGRTVLNAFSFSGGFSVYAARGGARRVTDLDISAQALSAAGRNFELNLKLDSVCACRREQVRAEAFEWLGGNAGRKFELVVLDPPSLARREVERAGAVRAYARLAELGMQHLARWGILVACSCSAHVSDAEFFGAVRRAVAGTGRGFRELETTGQPPDHPAAFEEARYLKGIYLVVE